MVEVVGTGPWYPDAATAGVGTNNKKVAGSAPGANTSTKLTTINPATWQLIKPGATSSGVTGGTGGSPSPTTGNNIGFNFLVADFDATNAGTSNQLPADRLLLAGTYTVAFTVNYSGINTANTFAALFYKRTAAGVLTFLASGVSASNASTTTSISFSVTLPRTVFAPGETLHVEFWYMGNDLVPGVTHETMTFNTGSANNFGGTLRYQYNRSYTGSATPSGALAKVAKKPLTGGVTPSGVLTKIANKPLVGSATPAGTLVKTPVKLLTGSAASSGVLSNRANKVLSGSVATSGTLTKIAKKSVSGSITPTGTVTKLIQRTFTGAISSIVGTLRKVPIKPFTGTVASSGTLVKTPVKSLGGTIAPGSSSMRWTVLKSVGGAITPVGTLFKRPNKYYTGTVTPGGALRNVPNKFFVGSVGSSGVVLRAVVKRFTGTLAPVGTIQKTVNKFFSGNLTPTATVKFTLAKFFRGFFYGPAGDGSGGVTIKWRKKYIPMGD